MSKNGKLMLLFLKWVHFTFYLHVMLPFKFSRNVKYGGFSFYYKRNNTDKEINVAYNRFWILE